MYFLGSFMTIFVTSVEQLMITFSVFQGKSPEAVPSPAVEPATHEFLLRRMVGIGIGLTKWNRIQLSQSNVCQEVKNVNVRLPLHATIRP